MNRISAEISEFLATSAALSRLPAAERDELARRIEISYHPAGETLLEYQPDNGQPSWLGLVRQGAVTLRTADGDMLEKRGEGEVFGHTIHFADGIGAYRVETFEDCLIYRLPGARIARLRQSCPAFDRYLQPLPGRRVSDTTAGAPAATLGEQIKRPPVCAPEDTSIAQSARLMTEADVTSLLLTGNSGLSGIVTDRDLRRRVLAQDHPSTFPVSTVMTPDPLSLGPDHTVEDALLIMMEHDFHHLPVVDDGHIIGLISLGDVLRRQSEHPVRLVQDIHRQNQVDGLIRISRKLPGLMSRLLEAGQRPAHLTRIITGLTDAFTRRLIVLAQDRLGPPPMAFAWIALGSQARREQTARTDQDNGLVLSAEPDAGAADYFAHLSEFVCEGLHQCGYVRCPGDIMASNREWRMPVEGWVGRFQRWIDTPDPKSVMFSSIFYDMRGIHGDISLIDSLRQIVFQSARHNSVFLRFMAQNALQHRPPLGFFRRFVLESDGSESEGLNLKHRGVVPVTDLARLHALAAGIHIPGTRERLRATAAAGVVSDDDASSLIDAFDLINQIRLEHQHQQMLAGERVSNLVDPAGLSPLARSHLRAAFNLVRDAQKALTLRYQIA